MAKFVVYIIGSLVFITINTVSWSALANPVCEAALKVKHKQNIASKVVQSATNIVAKSASMIPKKPDSVEAQLDDRVTERTRFLLSAIRNDSTLKKALEGNPAIAAYVYLKHVRFSEVNDSRMRAAEAMAKSYFAHKVSEAELAKIDKVVVAALETNSLSPMASTQENLGVDDLMVELNTYRESYTQNNKARKKQGTDFSKSNQKLRDLINGNMTISRQDERLFGLWGFGNLPHRSPDIEMRYYGTRLFDKPDGRMSPVDIVCLLYTSPSPRDATLSRMPSSA